LFKAEDYPNLLVGLQEADDAAVYRLNDQQALIFTTDFFTPIVDDPFTYGAVAAANAMSDIYAMGGEVLLALNIAAFADCLPRTMLSEILRGGAQKVAEAGGVVAGGHTINDDEPKFGLAVLGLVQPDRIMTKSRAQAGDHLVLTKRLGTGVITTALKRQVAAPDHVAGAVASMLRLNRLAAQIAQRHGVRAATDVTGFSLIGNALEIGGPSGVRIRVRAQAVPFLSGAVEYGERDVFPGGTHNNRSYFGRLVDVAPDVPEHVQLLLLTPETSGGLLLCVPPDRIEALLADCAAQGQDAWTVGDVVPGSGLQVT
jgi:selenide, water dikinase